VTQPALDFTAPQPRNFSRRRPLSLTERVLGVLEAKAGQWVDGRVLANVGGYAAFRTRISDARKLYGVTIENRWRTVKKTDGSRYRVSEYRLVKPT
jgi:hypothetical protein